MAKKNAVPTAAQILAEAAGHRLDIWVAVHLLERSAEAVPGWSCEIARAWEVHVFACEQLFGKRRKYLDALGGLAVVDGHRVAWPDVLSVFRMKFPEMICKAALLAHLHAEGVT